MLVIPVASATYTTAFVATQAPPPLPFLPLLCCCCGCMFFFTYLFFFLFSLLPLALPRPPVAYINPLGDLGPLHKLPGDWSLYSNSHFLPSPTNTKSLLLFFLINIASNDCINHFGKDGKVGCRKLVVGDNQRRALLCHL